MEKPQLIQLVFEARYERGYRYLDRCGEAMLMIEDALGIETGLCWLSGEATPTGAKIKCPDLEMTISFDSRHFVVEQEPIPADNRAAFGSIVKTALAIVMSRFDLREMSRVGYRCFHMIPTDSVEDSERLSVRYAPVVGWPLSPAENGYALRSAESVVFLESTGGSRGVRCSLSAVRKVEAPLAVDQRLYVHPRQQSKKQREALLAQLRRKAERSRKPQAGLMLDLDFYCEQPDRLDVTEFFDWAKGENEKLLQALVSHRRSHERQ